MTNTQEPDPFDGIDVRCGYCGLSIMPEEEIPCGLCGRLCCIYCAQSDENGLQICEECFAKE